MSKTRWMVLLMVAAMGVVGCATQQPDPFVAPDLGEARPWSDVGFKADPDDFQFAVISDRFGGRRKGVFTEALEKLNLLQPEFVISVGDLINGGNEDPKRFGAEYDELDEMLTGLDMRFFRTAGNHDISNPVMLSKYKKRYGTPYYHFLYKDVLFLVVCTEDGGQRGRISSDQVAYMTKALEENADARWTFVFMHNPLFVPNKKGEMNPQWTEIEDALKERQHTVFAGHWHNYGKREKHGQSYIRLATTGGGSGLNGIKTGKFDHLVWVTMTSQGPRIANLMLDGIHSEGVRLDK